LLVAVSVQAQTPPSSGTPTPADRQAMRDAVMKSCGADIKSYCSDKQPGRETMMCLRDNADKVSSGCKDTMASMRRNAPAPAQ
jgi:hypothetical protein